MSDLRSRLTPLLPPSAPFRRAPTAVRASPPCWNGATRRPAHPLLEGLADFLGLDLEGLRDAGNQVLALHLHHGGLVGEVGGADLDLDDLRGALADQQIVLPLDVIDLKSTEFSAR